MKRQFLLISFISVILASNYIDTRPKYVSDTSSFSYELSYEPFSGKLKTILKSSEIELNGRQIPSSQGIYIVDEYQKITINGDTLTFEVTNKLYIVLEAGYYYPSYSYSIGAVGFLKMETVEATMEPNEDIEVSFSENSKSFKLLGTFYNGYIISLRYVYITSNKDLFYKSQYVTVSPRGERYGVCKVIFEAEGDTIILGTIENLLPFDGQKIDYSQDCPENEFTDYVIITRYAAKWNSYFNWNAYNNNDNNGYLELIFPRMSLGGNNFILKNNVDTPFVKYVDENIVKHNGTHYIVTYNNPKSGLLNTNMSVSFINSIDNEFVFTMDESLVLNTSTENTRAKAKEILESDTSNEPDYIKLGRWVTKNMVYTYSYFGRDMTVDQILSELKGVCEHFTRLYNAFLSSIGIKAVYLGGAAITGEGGIPEDAKAVSHAWTMAKINGKWKAFDSTWGLYFDKFPISHVFRNYYNFRYAYRYSKVSVYDAKYDITFSEFVDENNLRQLKSEAEEALFIREEKFRKKEEDLIKKEKELNITEDELNIRESNLIPKEEELNEKEKELNNIELELFNKENELNNKEKELNSTALSLLEKQEELLEKETELNEKEIDIGEKKLELNNKEIELNNTESFLNNKTLELFEKEEKLNSTELILNSKEEKLNIKENQLNETELALNEKEENLYIKENQLNETESTLKEKEVELNETEEKLNNTEALLKNKEEELNEKETQLNSTELDLKTKEEILNEKELGLNSTEITLNEKEENLTKKERELNIKENDLDNKESYIKTKEDELNKKETNLTEKENDLNEKENELISKKTNLTEKENDLNEKENELISKETNLTKKENDLNEKESNLNEKENDLNEKVDELHSKETNLTKKEKNLNEKEINLNAKESDLDSREINIKPKEDELNKKESELNSKESDLNSKETNLTEKENDLNEKESDLNTKFK